MYTDPGPFASVFADVSRDSATGDHEVELRARAVVERLDEQGAPRDVVDTVTVLLTEVPDDTSPTSRMIVVTKAGVVMDDGVDSGAFGTPSSVCGHGLTLDPDAAAMYCVGRQ